MTALRALNIALGLDDRITGKLRGIDSQISGIESGALATQKEFSALEKATQEYGYTARQEIDGVGRDISELDRQIDENADITEKAADRSEKSWTKVGAAIGAAALATEAFVRSQQDHLVTAEGVSYLTGMTQREVTHLAGSLIDLSTTQEDAFGLMHAGARQGLRDAEDLSAYTRFWSDIGTAAREDSVALAEAGVSLRSVRIEAQDLTDHYDTFGFVMSKTTGSVSEFLSLTGYMARDMDSYGMEISDVAVLLASLEEKGMGAADSKRALRSAMSSAKGDTRALYRELGVTESQISRLSAEVHGSSDYITKMGDAFDDSRSPLQKLQTEFSKIATVLGSDLSPLLGDVSLVLSATSSALLAGASASFLYSSISTTALLPSLAAATASAWAFTAALLANPITWLVVGVIGLGVALYALYTRWDDISGWFMDKWEAVSGVVSGAMDGIRGAWDSTVGALISGAEWLTDRMDYLLLLCPFTAPIGAMHLLRDNWDDVVSAMGAGWDTFVGATREGVAWMGETIKGGLEQAKSTFYDYHPIGILVSQWDDITGYLRGIDLFEIGRDILLGFVGGILDVRDRLFDTVMGIGEGILDSITGFFGISSPSKLMEEMGGYVGEGFVQGIVASMPASLEWTINPQVAATTPYSVATSGAGDPGGVVAYRGVLSEPSIGALEGRAVYRAAVTEPTIDDLVASTIYTSQVSEPAVDDLAGVARYSSVIEDAGVHDLAGYVRYTSQVSAPAIDDLVGRAIYISEVTDLTVSSLEGQVVYCSVLDSPTVDALEGRAVYASQVSEPTVGALAGEVTYQGILCEPAVSTLEGKATYQSTLDVPAIDDLAGRAVYRGVVAEPMVPGLEGQVTYQGTLDVPAAPGLEGQVKYVSQVSKPTIDDLAGRAMYEGVLDVPAVSTLAGEVTYRSSLSVPAVDALTGEIAYLSSLSVPAVGSLEGEAVYISQVSEPGIGTLEGQVTYQGVLTEPTISALYGEAIYSSTLLEPEVPVLSGIVEYHGALTGVPDVSDIGSRYGSALSQINDTGPSWTPESDVMSHLGKYTPESDARQAGDTIYGDIVFSPTINVESQGGDAKEIATVVDRRLRQSFDRHANVYFGRQRRRRLG